VSILYPRTLTFKRPVPTPAGGLATYQGANEGQETLLIAGISANVVIDSSRTGSSPALPDDSGKVSWNMVIPFPDAGLLPLIEEEDRVYDDLGRRFQVSAYQPSSVGALVKAVRLKS
jgi:hypothetical protein